METGHYMIQKVQAFSEVSIPLDEYAQLECVYVILAATSTPHTGSSITQLEWRNVRTNTYSLPILWTNAEVETWTSSVGE